MILKFLFIYFGKQVLIFFNEIGRNLKIYERFGFVTNRHQVIDNPQNIQIGKSFNIGDYCQLLAQGDKGESFINIGENVALNYNVMINADCGGRIVVGDDVRIGPYTVLRASNHRYSEISQPIYKQGHEKGLIVICDDVWIGAHVTILPNVTIGKSSIIGAGSVVNKDIPSHSIAVGVPAKIIKQRI